MSVNKSHNRRQSWFASRLAFTVICSFATLILTAAGSAVADTMSLVTSASSQASNDSLSWGQLGPDGTILGAALSVKMASGATVQTLLGGANSVSSVVCPASPCSWNSAGFAAGDVLLWTSDLGNGGNGPVTLSFSPGIFGAGALVQPDGPGPFIAKIEAFNGSTSLGSFTVASNAAGDATYVGIKDLTGSNITSIVISFTSGTGNLTDFAVDTVKLNVPGPGPVVGLSTTNLTFGNQTVGTSSTSQSITLSNPGTSSLNITSIMPSGDYSATNNCPGSLGVGLNCVISVTFTPTAPGSRPGSITIVDNASGSPHSVSLSGTGVVPALIIAKTHGGSLTQGQNGATYTITVTNSGLGATNGTVTVTDNPTAGITLVSMSGLGWTCPGNAPNNCQRNDSLAGGGAYPAIIVKVNVVSNATSPQVNSATVSGGASPSASVSDTATVIIPGSINLPANVVAPPGNVFVAFPVTLSAPAADVVFVTLTSSDPSKVALSAGGAASTSFSIQAGQTAPSVTSKIYGVDLGSAIITASALGYSSASQTVQVRATTVFSPNPLPISPGSNKRVTLLLSSPSPGGVTVNLSADNPAIASLPSSVAFGPNVTSVIINVNGLAQGSTLVHARALPFIPDSTCTVIVGNPGPPVVVTTSLSDGQVGLQYSQNLTATGGIVPLKWSLIAGQIPNGLALDPSGVISGTPTVTASNTPLTFQVADASVPAQTATVTLTLTINFQGALTITSTALPNGTMNSAYSAPVTAAGGKTPYTFSLAAGSVLPSGLSLNPSTGVISGTPTVTVSNLSLTFVVTDSSAPVQTATKTLSLTIGSAALTINTTSLADGVINKPYSQQLQASGGTAPFTWSVIGSRLPTNYTLDPVSGKITSDTGTCCIGTFQVTFQVADSSQQTATKILVIVVGDGSLQLLTTSLPNGQVGVPYNATLAAKSGTPPYQWSVSGLLPAGLSLNSSTGQVSGTPTAVGSSRVQFIVTDTSTPVPQTQSVFLTLVINNGPPVISTTSLPNGVVGGSYSATVIAAGGTAPYTWSATGLPAGLSINSISGVISGTPMSAGTSTASVTVRDSSSPQLAAATNLGITITPPTPVAITTTTLPSGAVNSAYSATVSASGGATPYSWFASGLPAGLSINASTGVISGIPTSPGTTTASITVTDATNPVHQTATANLSVSIASQPLTLATNSLPSGNPGVAYNVVLMAAGGTPAYNWSATGLPGGLQIDPVAGTISGTPTGGGTASVTITVKDSAQPPLSVSKTLSLSVVPKLSIMTMLLPNGSLNLPYTGSVSVAGGVPPYKFMLSGAPSNLGISSAGNFTGAPMSTGTFTFTVTVSDSSTPAQVASNNYTINVVAGLVIIVTGLPPGKVGSSYTTVMMSQGGFAPLVWSASGLPPGISINPEYGVIEGVPTVAGTYQSTVMLRDAVNQSVAVTYTLVIAP